MAGHGVYGAYGGAYGASIYSNMGDPLGNPLDRPRSAPVGGSCRYTSWSRQPADVDRIVEEIMEGSEVEDEEDEIERAGALLHKLSAVPPEAPEQAEHCNFSWKELELSCKKLDDAHITISQIDLSCIEETDDASPNGLNIVYNFHVDDTASASIPRASTPSALTPSRQSPRRCSGDSFSSGGVKTPFASSEQSSPAGSGEFRSTSCKLEQYGSTNLTVAQGPKGQHSRFFQGQSGFPGRAQSLTSKGESASQSPCCTVSPPALHAGMDERSLVGDLPITVEAMEPSEKEPKKTGDVQLQQFFVGHGEGQRRDSVQDGSSVQGAPRTSRISAYARSVALKLGLAVHRYGDKKNNEAWK